MEIKKELKLIEEEKAANAQHVQDFKESRVKTWKVSYNYIQGGIEAEEDYFLKATDIRYALEGTMDKLIADAEEQGWEAWKIWNIGIMEDDIW